MSASTSPYPCGIWAVRSVENALITSVTSQACMRGPGPLAYAHGPAGQAQGLSDRDRLPRAYVAAPSHKAALAAWGSEGNLFAQGLAEAVTDPDLMSEALAWPGKVLRRSRDSSREQLAALGQTSAKARRPTRETEPDRTVPGQEKESDAPKRIKAGAPKPPRARPSRRPIERSEARLADAAPHHAAEFARLVERERELHRERRALQRRHAAETERLERALDKARKRYQQALHNNVV